MRRWGRALLVGGVLLLALPAAAQNAECHGECKQKSVDALSVCVDKCPRQGSDVSKDLRFQKCAMRCSDSSKTQLKACKNRCDGKRGTDKGGTKKSRQRH